MIHGERNRVDEGTKASALAQKRDTDGRHVRAMVGNTIPHQVAVMSAKGPAHSDTPPLKPYT